MWNQCNHPNVFFKKCKSLILRHRREDKREGGERKVDKIGARRENAVGRGEYIKERRDNRGREEIRERGEERKEKRANICSVMIIFLLSRFSNSNRSLQLYREIRVRLKVAQTQNSRYGNSTKREYINFLGIEVCFASCFYC